MAALNPKLAVLVEAARADLAGAREQLLKIVRTALKDNEGHVERTAEVLQMGRRNFKRLMTTYKLRPFAAKLREKAAEKAKAAAEEERARAVAAGLAPPPKARRARAPKPPPSE